MRSRSIAAFATILALSPIARAHADDGLAGEGEALTIGGGISAVGGGVLVATGRNDDPDNFVYHAERPIGAGLLAGGVTAMAFGVPLWTAGSHAHGDRVDDTAMHEGAWMTALGVTALSSGVTTLFADHDGKTWATAPGATLTFLGVFATGAGIPMWIGGGATPEGTRPKSVVMRSWGIGLVTIGALAAALGGTTAILASKGSSDGAVVIEAYGAVLAIAGGVVGGIGIPLWIVGAGDAKTTASTSKTRALFPEISIGPRSIVARVHF